MMKVEKIKTLIFVIIKVQWRLKESIQERFPKQCSKYSNRFIILYYLICINLNDSIAHKFTVKCLFYG